MKRNKIIAMLMGLAVILSATDAHAISQGEKDKINNFIPGAYGMNLGNKMQKGLVQVASAVWNFNKHGGSTGDIDLGVAIPAGAILMNSYYKVLSRVTSNGTPAVTFGASTFNNLVTSFNPVSLSDSYSTLRQSSSGVPVGTLVTFQHHGSTARNIKMRLSTAHLTAGKIQVFVEYMVDGE